MSAPIPGRLRAVALAAALAVSTIGYAGMTPSRGAFTAGVQNPTNSVTAGYTTCLAAGQGLGARRLYPLGDFSLVTLLPAVDRGTDGANGAYQGYLLTTTTSGPCHLDTTPATPLNGSTQWVSTPQTLTFTGTSNLTESVWFKTSVRQGLLMGIGNSASGSSTTYGLQMMINSSGKLAFGTNDGTPHEIVGSPVVTDNAWHLATAVYAAGTTTLYLDGQPVAASGAGAAPTGTLANCYLHIGWDNTSAFANGTSNVTAQHFSGSLAFADLFPAALTARQVLLLYRSA